MLYADFHECYGINLAEVVYDMGHGGSFYTPRLLLSLIFELPPDSRFIAVHRDGDEGYRAWRQWGSVTFLNQLLANISNVNQAHMLGSLEWADGKRPEYSPINDPGVTVEETKPPSLEEISGVFFNA